MSQLSTLNPTQVKGTAPHDAGPENPIPDNRTQVAEPCAGHRPLLVPPAVAARILGISRSTFYGLLAQRELRGIHIGRALRVPVSELENWVTRRLEASDATV
jgi:excisionase family DNA binding protein